MMLGDSPNAAKCRKSVGLHFETQRVLLDNLCRYWYNFLCKIEINIV